MNIRAFAILGFFVCNMFYGCRYSPPPRIFRFTDTIAFKIDQAVITQYRDFSMLNVRSIWLEEDPTEKYWVRVTWSPPHDIKPPELKSWYYKVFRKEGETEGTPFMLEIKGPVLSEELLVTLEPKDGSTESISLTVPYGKPIRKVDKEG